MLSRFDPLYDVLNSFEHSEVRFARRYPERVSDPDYLCTQEFVSYHPALPRGAWMKDLDIGFIARHLLKPKYSLRFIYTVLENTPLDQATALYRQEGVRELVEKPDFAAKLENSLTSLADLNDAIHSRNNAKRNLTHEYSHNLFFTFEKMLKGITPYNLNVLAAYVQATKQLADLLHEAESRPLQRAGAYLEEIKRTDYFKSVEPLLGLEHFQPSNITLETNITHNGELQNTKILQDSKDPERSLPGHAKRFWRFLHTGQSAPIIAMRAADAIADNLDALTLPVSLLGPLEFYTSLVGFHRTMRSEGLPASFPTLLPKEERRMSLINACNPFLLYQLHDMDQITKIQGRKIVGNDYSYDSSNNIKIISGPNQAGKSVSLRTIGIQLLLAMNGGPITASSGTVSIIDGLYTHFAGQDNILKGEGALMRELVSYDKNIFRHVTPYSVALMDEPTTGTDATGGRTLLKRILRKHHRMGTTTFVTTHHHEIGDLVDSGILYCASTYCPELVNDPETGKMRKTFKIIPGRSSTSLAEEVAEQVGMSEDDMDRVILERVSSGALDQALFRKDRKE